MTRGAINGFGLIGCNFFRAYLGRQHQPISGLTQRTAVHGVRALRVGEQDVEAVHLAVREALARALRLGPGLSRPRGGADWRQSRRPRSRASTWKGDQR